VNYREYLEEAVKDVDPALRKIFNSALLQVFSQRYLGEIAKKVGDNLLIKQVDEKPGIVAFNVGSKIYINKNEFWDYDQKQQARYLLHEFIHVLQRKGGAFLSKFPEIRTLSKKIHKIYKQHSSQPLSVFLTGKNTDLGAGGKWEVMSYFMNDSIDWRAIDNEGKAAIISEIKNSGIFNTNSPFWKKRLPY
jgi:hypothetical protein